MGFACCCEPIMGQSKPLTKVLSQKGTKRHHVHTRTLELRSQAGSGDHQVHEMAEGKAWDTSDTQDWTAPEEGLHEPSEESSCNHGGHQVCHQLSTSGSGFSICNTWTRHLIVLFLSQSMSLLGCNPCSGSSCLDSTLKTSPRSLMHGMVQAGMM